jgi:hypothetical protein
LNRQRAGGFDLANYGQSARSVDFFYFLFRNFVMRFCSIIGVVGLCLLVGCSSASVSGTVPASGKVTYKGAPLEGAIITFIPEGAGRTATAESQAGGVFSLTTVDASGAMPGKYKVTVDKVDFAAGGSSSMEDASSANAAEGKSKRALPAKYAQVTSTPLVAEIPSGGKTDIDLALVD